MHSLTQRLERIPARLGDISPALLWLMIFAAVALSHATLLQLPYFWDEGGYYIPAALDFYHHGWLIPHFTNAHPPLPNILLGTLWHLVGFHLFATRLFVCAVAAAGLTAVFRIAQRLLDATAAVCLTLLTGVYPIWFAQSSLAHADIFAAAFTLWALAVWLPATQASAGPRTGFHVGTLVWTAILFSFSVLAKETAIVWPATLAAVELVFALRMVRDRTVCHGHLRRLAAVAFPVLPLAAWFLYHRLATGFMFGNPEYLRYNATANLTFAHIAQAFRYRFLHLFWQRDIWLPITLALACLFLPRRTPLPRSLEPGILRLIGLLVAANWIFFSVLGGAELTRYLLPVYPLTLMVCFSFWRQRSELWPLFTTVTTAAFISALWINPPTSFAPEDNLTYRNMIVVHQQAIDYVAQHYPGATVLTAWPVSADLFRPELGYVKQPIRAYAIENFTRTEIEKAAQVPGEYDTAIVFTTHYTTPAFQAWLLAHPDSRRGREYNATRDLTPAEIAIMLGGRIVFEKDLDGEWAAVLRFPRSYEALLGNDMGTPRLFVQTAASSFGP